MGRFNGKYKATFNYKGTLNCKYKGTSGKDWDMRNVLKFNNKKGMELVQVAILVAIAIALGLIFKTQITDFVNTTFEGLKKFN